jgi:hypothetical protein
MSLMIPANNDWQVMVFDASCCHALGRAETVEDILSHFLDIKGLKVPFSKILFEAHIPYKEFFRGELLSRFHI